MNTFPNGGITVFDLANFQLAYEQSPTARLLTNAFHKLNINDLALNANELATQSFVFSNDITTLPATHQKASGRCWLFAATNCLREIVAKKNNLENFELSQSWLAFWDKFERANFFLESIIATADRPTDDRTVDFILKTGVGDGGQWDMFVNIINKYGICPKAAFGETAQSSGTHNMNALLNLALKHDAVVLRNMVAKGASATDIAQAKGDMIAKIYTFLTTCYGSPVKTFDFEYKTKDGKYGRETGYTPLSFKEHYFGNILDDYVSIINAPTADKPFNRTFTVDFLGNVAEAAPLKYLNLEMPVFKDIVLQQLLANEIVWFGSDCGKQGEREKCLWDASIYDFTSVSGLDTSLTKAEMLDYGYSAMNHAMVITGVNLVDGKPNRWKIENSWGQDGPNKGYFFMSDSWFDSFVFQAVVNKKYLSPALLEALNTTPIVLAPWDPMGTLAD